MRMLRGGVSRIKGAVKKNQWLLMAYLIVSEHLYALRYTLGWVGSGSGMAHARSDVQESIDYIDEVYGDYLAYAGISKPFGSVAEVGPGDSCGVAMRFMADGCEKVDLVDRFYTKRDPLYHSRVYEVLLSKYPELAQQWGASDLKDEQTFPNVSRYYGPDAASEKFFHVPDSYDFIVSRAVLEHVQDPVLSLKNMITALRPGGWMLHKVDLRDHGMFTPEWHELKFLEIPEWIYRRMVHWSGRPNRRLIDVYRNVLSQSDCEWRILVTRLAGVGPIEPHQEYANIPESMRVSALGYVRSIKKDVCAALHDVSDADLSVAGLFLVVHKPKAEPSVA